jgi:hypothetical protein
VHFGKLSPSRERNTFVTIGFGQVVIDSRRADEIAAFWSALPELRQGKNRLHLTGSQPANVRELPELTGAGPEGLDCPSAV